MNIVITGINGFVGTILRRLLEEKGHPVSGIDIRSSDSNVHAVDITDQAAVMRTMDELQPDFIFHLAAISRVDYTNPSLLYSINVTGTLNILTATTHLAKKPGFLLASSSQVYGIVDDASQPITEQAPIRPVNHYGASKASAEHLVQVFHHEHGLPFAIVRPFNHIGRGQDPHFVIPKIVKSIREKNTSIQLGNLNVMRDFLDVRDVGDAYIRIMENFKDGGVFNIASGTAYRLSDMVGLIQEIARVKLDIHHSDSLIRKNEILKAIGDSSAFMKQYNWHPMYSIRDSLEWMLSE
ncbi:MAG TPA: GDP-mannose 4,6-dehydratase [Spirochaetota bacterium]|nr:GDP-mannose 4,6-dehydratase [Spirochaetota bacterium]HPC39375.1 GDP-mannose 4,6-dehydratase [Spirochaetota bacterium]HPL18642.1 GDP-mannose 4,6-dehydratase [Spirochaetota bacterium]HQF10633.1 GDP-mannose 4,6-dehydratase [Spirochaetota bacterium]HQH99628.1 GDP-mannose 4,6-dehydratase [Spirochaetota bacterium]